MPNSQPGGLPLVCSLSFQHICNYSSCWEAVLHLKLADALCQGDKVSTHLTCNVEHKRWNILSLMHDHITLQSIEGRLRALPLGLADLRLAIK